MKRNTSLLNFRETFYNRVKTVLLNEDLISDLSKRDLARLKSIYIYDFYDNIKRLTTEIAFLADKKRLGTNKALEINQNIRIQIKNILFISKIIAKNVYKSKVGKYKRIEEQKEILHD